MDGETGIEECEILGDSAHGRRCRGACAMVQEVLQLREHILHTEHKLGGSPVTAGMGHPC